MAAWDKLAELRIQEWMSKPAAERATPSNGHQAAPPLELQLLDEVLGLYGEARQTKSPDARRETFRRAAEVEARLMVLLEKEERPLAAQYFASRLRAARES